MSTRPLPHSCTNPLDVWGLSPRRGGPRDRRKPGLPQKCRTRRKTPPSSVERDNDGLCPHSDPFATATRIGAWVYSAANRHSSLHAIWPRQARNRPVGRRIASKRASGPNRGPQSRHMARHLFSRIRFDPVPVIAARDDQPNDLSRIPCSASSAGRYTASPSYRRTAFQALIFHSPLDVRHQVRR